MSFENMSKTDSTEAVRRGFHILDMMNERPLTSSQIREKLINNYGIRVSLRRIQDQMWDLTDIFPTRIEVDDTKKPYLYKLPKNHRKFSNMSPMEAVCLELAFDYLFPLLPNKSMDPMKPYLREAEATLKQNSAKQMRNWKNKVLTLNEGLQLQPAKVSNRVLQDIHAALWEGNTVMASYISKNKAFPSDYELHPAGLVYRGRISYLVCSFANDTTKIIYLPLQRFRSIKLLDGNFNIKKIEQRKPDLSDNKTKDEIIEISQEFTDIEEQHFRKMLKQGGIISIQGNEYEIKRTENKFRNSKGEYETAAKPHKASDWE